MVKAVRIAASGLLAALLAACTTSPGRLAAHRLPGRVRGPFTAFVVNEGSDTVTPFDTATRRVSRPIKVGSSPVAIAITPDGRTAYVVNSDSGTVTPISIATRTALEPIRVGTRPDAIAITPDGKTVYVANADSRTVTPISTATNETAAPIRVGPQPDAIAITPDGKTAYRVTAMAKARRRHAQTMRKCDAAPPSRRLQLELRAPMAPASPTVSRCDPHSGG